MIENGLFFGFGTIAGIFVMSLVFFYTPDTILHKGYKALEICEKSLPRDQVCIITAIPENQNN